MKFFKKIKDNFTGYLYDSSITIKDRTFVLFTICELTALMVFLIAGVVIGDDPINIVIGLAVVILGGILLYICVKKDKLNIARIIVALTLVLVLRPIAFFLVGGLDGGGIVMFLLGGYYLVIILDGKFRIIMVLLDTIIYITSIVVTYYYPEFVPEGARSNNYYNSAVQYVIGLAVLTILITFWTRILKKETDSAEEKTKELEELNRSQNRFFSSMSHEIRTPINTVLGMNEIILRQEDASEEIKKDARNIQGAGKMLLALINDILDVSKIEAGRMDIVPVEYNVGELLSEIVNMIWLKAEEKNLEFKVDVDPDVPTVLYGDEVRIKQILINLLNNAVKYTEKGSINLHIECERTDEETVYLKIVVSDTGMGIKPEALPHLFDTFKRVDEEKNRYIEGTGLGLSIVKQLVELMDGEIAVSSVYSQGSTFTITLKQDVSSDESIGNIDITNASTSSDFEKFEHSFRAPGARILFVDDNEMNLEVEKKLILGTEIKVELSLSGADALKKTLRHNYDVIFMDHLMPEMDGIECFEKIRRQDGGLNRNTPIIVLTANAGSENIEAYNNTGFDGYLVKPVSGMQLEKMLLEHLPDDKIIRNDSNEMTGAHISTAGLYARKKPVSIGTSSMTDMPEDVIEDLDIKISPFRVITDEGVFLDNIDLDSDEVVRYMGEENRIVESLPASYDDFVKFFTRELKNAHHIIYITISSTASIEYKTVTKAAALFENVTVINSELFSSATGILAMIAGKLAKQNLPVDRIISELEEAKKLIHCSFVIRDTGTMARRGQISSMANSIMKSLWIRPVLSLKNDKLGLGKILLGDSRKCYEKYIKHTLSMKVKPNTDLAFITSVGMSEEDLTWITEMVKERVPFKNIIYKKASAGIASNCGAGTFGILYMDKSERDYKLDTLLYDSIDSGYVEPEEVEEDDEDLVEEDVIEEESDEATEQSDTAKEWYEEIEEIDSSAGIKNSGSKDSYMSVLKIYHDSYYIKSEEIQGFFEDENWKDYTIKVHALKSSSRLVGALRLGDKAEALEMAGKEEDIDYIRSHHDEVMNDYRAIYESLKKEYGTYEENLPEIPSDTLEEAYQAIEEFSMAMDYECVKMVMDSVKEYSMSNDDKERFDKINKLLSEMDWDGIKKVISGRNN